VERGETIVTSGGDRIFPKGLPVGTIADVSPGSDLFLNIRVKPAADLNRLEEVLIITELAATSENAGGTSQRAAAIRAQRLPRPRPRRQRHPQKINRRHHRRTRRRNERRRNLYFARADRGPPVHAGGYHRHSAGGHFSASLSPYRLARAPAFFQRLRSAFAG